MLLSIYKKYALNYKENKSIKVRKTKPKVNLLFFIKDHKRNFLMLVKKVSNLFCPVGVLTWAISDSEVHVEQLKAMARL